MNEQILAHPPERDPADQPPRCTVCGQRAWPGDEARHVWSVHVLFERAREAAHMTKAAA